MVGRALWLLAAATLAFATASLAAQADEWRLVRSSGQVWIGSDSAQPVSLAPTTEVPEGATLVTGPNGRALLARGTETMVVGPDSVVQVPGDRGGRTTIFQRAGEIVFDVEKQNVQHFGVETPYLAAVVKGTRFTVRVTAEGAVVLVDRGVVEVLALATGEASDVLKGQSATVPRLGGNMKLRGVGTLSAITSGSPRAAKVAAVTGSVWGLTSATAAGGLALGLTADRDNPNGSGVAVGLNGGNAGGNGNGNAGGNGNGSAGGTGNGNAGGNGDAGGNDEGDE